MRKKSILYECFHHSNLAFYHFDYFRSQSPQACQILLQKVIINTNKMQEKPEASTPQIKNIGDMIEVFKNPKLLKQALKQANLKYSVSSFKINKLRLKEIPELINLIDINYINLVKDHSEDAERRRTTWMPNELKLFVWVVVCYGYIKKKYIQNFDDEDWQFFSPIFPHKTVEELDFQSKFLLKNYRGNKQKWDPQQQELLKRIMEQQNLQNRWNDISKALYLHSNKKFYRSSQKCREYWFNHLDPKLNKGPWSYDEDMKLLDQLSRYGYKWAKITQLFEQVWGYKRTQHMIKNRTKLLCKKYGFKNQGQLSCRKQLEHIRKKINQERNKMFEQEQKKQKEKNSPEVQVKLQAEQNQIQPQQQNYLISSRGNCPFDENFKQSFQQFQVNYPPTSFQRSSGFTPNIVNLAAQNSQLVGRIKRQVQNYHEKDTSPAKKNVIVLQKPSKTLSLQKQTPQQQQYSQPEIQIESYHEKEHENSERAQSSQQQKQKEQSYFDEFQIVEEVDNDQIDLNEQIKFDHEQHGGKMRERVTHQLAKFFNQKQNSESHQN